MPARQTVRILLIENDFEQGHGIRLAIERQRPGLQVTVCRDAAELTCLPGSPAGDPDVVICADPVSGIPAAEILDRLRSGSPDPPAILLLEENSTASNPDVLTVGVRDSLVKDTAGNYLRLLPVLIDAILDREDPVECVALDDSFRSSSVEPACLGLHMEDTWTDLPHRMQVEAELRRMKAWLRVLVEHQSAAIVLELENGRIGLANRELCNLFELCESPYDLVGENWQEIVTVIIGSFEESERFAGCVEGLSHGCASVAGREWSLRDGRTLEMECEPIFRGDEFRGRLWCFRDVTRRRQEERALRWAARMEATSTLAGGIAHDFNNLMQAVLGNAELLMELLQGNRQAIHMLEQMFRSARRGGELAQQMLAYARGGKYLPRKCDLSESVAEIVRLQDVVDHHRIEIDFDMAELPAVGEADADQLATVVLSLLANAVEAIEGKGRISLATRRERIRQGGVEGVPTSCPGEYVVLTVRDSGTGMEPATLARVFEPFFSTKFQGRGLGLAAVYGIVKNHGGYITAQSDPGLGSTFRVYLPALEQERFRSAEMVPVRLDPRAARV